MPHNRKAIVIAGEWNSANLGDEIICKTVKFLLKGCLSNDNTYSLIQVDVSMNKQQNVMEKALVFILRRLNRKILFKYKSLLLGNKIKQLNSQYIIEKMIVPGGAIFQEYFAMACMALIKKAAQYNIPVFFNACGYGPNTAYSLSVFKWILKHPCVKQVTTRDDLSLISSNGIKVVPDAAILAYRYYNFIIHKDQQVIGINIIAPEHYLQNSNDATTRSFFDNTLISMIEKTAAVYKVVLFSNGACEDQAYIDWLYERLGHLRNMTREERPKNGFELVKIISGFSLVIGFRLHSLIVSYSYNIPAIGIAWDNKLASWGQMTGNSNTYTLSRLPVECIPELIKESIRTGINKDRKAEMEGQIMEQIKTYINHKEGFY